MYAQLQRISGEMSCQSLFMIWNLWEHTRLRLSATLQMRTRAAKKSPIECCIRETAWQEVKKQRCTHWKLSYTTAPCPQPKHHLARRLLLVALQTPSFYSFILSIDKDLLFIFWGCFWTSLCLASTRYAPCSPVPFHNKETTPVEDCQRISSAGQNHCDGLIHKPFNGRAVHQGTGIEAPACYNSS